MSDIGENMMQKITSHLWFDREAVQAAEFYVSAFMGSKLNSVTKLHGTPSGTVDIVSIDLMGQDFTLIRAGPLFKFNPSISFLVACKTKKDVDELWAKLFEGGIALMDLGEYPFSERYGWLQDRYGLSWQIMFMGGYEILQNITPTLMFTDKQCGRAEEAVNFYASVFRDSEVGDILRYSEGEEPDRGGTIKHAAFRLEGMEFAAMDSVRVHDIAFNEAISFIVHCETQSDIDYYWGRLSADLQAEQCGWLKDRFGVSWQIVPAILDEMLLDQDGESVERVTEAFLKMKKFDIEALVRAYRG
jgi:predicted 3-demethylubiquinone-9 3-methyltransferase (glyoxalase superfamily)